MQERLQAAAPGLAMTRRLCDVGHNTSFPRVSPDGVTVAFLSTDEGRQPLALYVADVQDCKPRRLARVNSAHALSWTPDGRSIVLSQFMLVDNARVFADLFRIEVGSGAVTRLTRAARLTSPDVHPSGRTIVAVQYEHDRSRLVTVDLDSTRIAPLTQFSSDTAWGPARWSPDGARLAAVRFTRGASYDLVLLSADGQVLRKLTEDRALEGIPEWDASAPPGIGRLFFTSDRTGLRELYGLELDGDANPQLYLTARVATGLHEVTIIPDARSGRTVIVATVTHADGRHLERLEVDRGSWVASPTAVAQYAAQPGPPDTVPAVSDPAARPYSPARDLMPTGWSPVLAIRGELGTFAGAATSGVDVIGRHQWQGGAAVSQDGRVRGSAGYGYRRFPRAQLFAQVSSTWRLEQRVESPDGEVLRLERKRSAAVGAAFPLRTLRRRALLSARLEIEERHREDAGDSAAVAAAEPIRQHPALFGGGVGLAFGNTQAGVRSISGQDGVWASLAADYLKAAADDRWRSGWDATSSVYRSFPSWTSSSRPVLGASVRVAEERGPAASRLTAGGVGATAVVEGGSTNFEVRGYPEGLVAAGALWGARTELRLPLARISRGLGASPLYLRRLSASWFIDSVGAADRVNQLGAPQMLSTGAELASDVSLFSFLAVRIRTGVGVPLKALGPVSRGDARFYMAAGTSF
jgi:Tol biopolymer transport system component